MTIGFAMIVPLDKGLYWKVHCWDTIGRPVCKFVFPKTDTNVLYSMDSIYLLRKDVIKPILENLLGEEIKDEKFDNTFVDRINDIFCRMNQNTVCQICSTSNSVQHIVEKDLPTCTHCKALLMV